MKNITKTIWILSLVSLFTDAASEMLYPVMPVYLNSIGFSVVLIGVLEGIAEATAGFSKGYFGKLSDTTGKRVPFVQLGYSLSAISKPLMGIFTFPLWIFFSRTLDRFGKGIRTGARDALLSDESSKERKGETFGFHKSMDTLGAVLGPIIAMIYLYYFPQNYKALFFIAFIPGLLAVITTLFIKEKKTEKQQKFVAVPFFSFMNYWKKSPKIYRKVVIGLLVFTLFNSSDMFLLLKAKQSGINDTFIIGLYIFYNLIYALFAYPLGILADKIGLKSILIVGLFIFSFVYIGIGFTNNLFAYILLFFMYGVYAAATDGISKAWISNITNKNDTATAIGTYSGFQSVCAMFASSLAGLIWFYFNSSTAFILTGIVTLFIAVYFILLPNPPQKIETETATEET